MSLAMFAEKPSQSACIAGGKVLREGMGQATGVPAKEIWVWR